MAARFCRITNAATPAAATSASPSATVPAFGTAAKLIASTNAEIMTTEMIPPKLSTGSVASLMCAGTNSDGHHEGNDRERQREQEDGPPPEMLQQVPAASGPSAEMAPPKADHSAIDRVRAGPDHSAVINASVVG